VITSGGLTKVMLQFGSGVIFDRNLIVSPATMKLPRPAW
jgi:hypothetical protein